MFRLISVVLVFMIAATVSAQDAVPFGPIGSVEAGDFRALTVTADGTRLLIADAENDQLRVYDFRDPSAPALLSSVDLDGEPVAVAAANGFALVAVSTPEPGDAVRVIAPSRYSRTRSYVEVNSLDVPDGVTRLAISPDHYWALVGGSGGYTLLELIAAGEINSLPVAGAFIDAAVSADTAYLLSETRLVTQALAANVALARGEQVDLEGDGQRIMLNEAATVGVVVLADNTLVLFDPATLATFSAFTAGGAAIRDARFVSGGDRDLLALSRAGSSAIDLLDASDPTNLSALEPVATGFETPVQAMTTHADLIVATDGQTVRIFQR